MIGSAVSVLGAVIILGLWAIGVALVLGFTHGPAKAISRGKCPICGHSPCRCEPEGSS